MDVIFNQVYNIRGNAKSLKLLSLDPERNQYYNGYFINVYVFYIEEYGEGDNTYNNGVYDVNGSIFNEFEFDYYGKLEKVI